jgi:hypothetical protein
MEQGDPFPQTEGDEKLDKMIEGAVLKKTKQYLFHLPNDFFLMEKRLMSSIGG